MKFRKTIRRSRIAMTLVEVMIASSIAAATSMAIVSSFTLASRFLAQGFVETRLLNNSSLAVEKISRSLNSAYRLDAIEADRRPVISADRRSIEFTVPLDNGAVERQRIRYDSGDREIAHERQDGTGNFADITERKFLRNVDDFFIANQEGLLSFVITVRVDMGRNGEKQFSMVGRALPRNL